MYFNQPSQRRTSPLNKFNQGKIFLSLVTLITIIIIIRLFTLQVIKYDFYRTEALKEHMGQSELPAHRGEIFIKDYASNEPVRIATNITLDLLYADPFVIKDKQIVADRIAPIIFSLEEAREIDTERVITEQRKAQTDEELEKIRPLTDTELYQKFHSEILEKISQNIRPVVNLSSNLPPETLNEIKKLNLPGIIIDGNTLKAYPSQITDFQLTAEKLSPFLNRAPKSIETSLKGINRYVILKRKIPPKISAKIKEIIKNDPQKSFTGLGLRQEYFRYYPENELAANIIGYINKDNIGNYGIEEKFNSILEGKKGIFQTQRDGGGRQITIGDTIIQPAIDGANITLTIDRTIQMYVEQRLAKGVKDYRADSGQAIIMDPKTGKIIAMAHYPTFNPNTYSKAFETEIIKLNSDQIKNLIPIENSPGSYWLYYDLPSQDKILIFEQKLENDKTIYRKYKNKVGAEVYQNKIVSLPYEPGSVFKVIAMAIAIDDHDVTPSQRINDPGYVEVELRPGVKKQIRNVSTRCTGKISMTEILAYSCNTGMAFIAKQMGQNLFYNYMLKFGFGKRTYIEFDNEHPGKIDNKLWAESELYTKAFGQGLTVTMIQMVSALSAIANKGILMQPYIVESIEYSPENISKTEPKIISQVITEDTAKIITSMMISTVENGVSKNTSLENYYLAAKTGTAQTYKNGEPLFGAGTTLASVGGFGPVKDPKWVMLVKLDRPRTSEYADSTTSFIFKDIANFLYEYYSIQPDKK